MPSKSLRSVLTWQSLLAFTLPLAIAVVACLLWAVPQIRQDAGARQIMLANAISLQVKSHLEAGAAMIKASAALNLSDPAHPDQSRQQLNAMLNATDALSSMYVVTSDGKISLVSLKKGTQNHLNDLTNINLSHNPLFIKISNNKSALWSETFLSVITGGSTVAYGAPGKNAIVIGEIDLTLLSTFLKQISTPDSGLIMIIDHSGQVVADNSGTYTAQQFNISNIPLIRSGINSDAPTTGHFSFDGHEMTGSIVQIPGVDWHVVIARSDISLYRTSLTITLVILAGILAALSCGIATSIYQARTLAERFNELTSHARDIAEGNRTKNWPTSEITEFNQLSADLQDMSKQLQYSETLYRTLFDQLPDGVILWTVPSLRPFQFNAAAHTMLGYSRDEFATLTVSDFDVQLGHNGVIEMLEKVHHNGTCNFEAEHRSKSGDSRYMLVTLRLLELAEQPLILATHRDVTELRHSTRTLELYRYALDSARDSIFLLGRDARFQYVNDAVCTLLGYSRQELLEMHVFDIDPDFPAEVWQTHWNELRQQDDMGVETKHLTRDGRLIPVEINIRLFTFRGVEYLLSMARDLTERHKFEDERLKLEQQLLHAQKMESLGVLAGGIAHDFNNILMAIIGNADLALMRINKESPAVQNLQRIEHAAARAADLAKQMLAYSGKGKFVVEDIDLNTILNEMLHMLEVSISKKAVLRLTPHTSLPTIEADATQIRQVVMNLVINASEAIGDKSGVIAISTGCMECDHRYLSNVWLDENLSEGLYVYLEIADTGCGMDKETMAKLFDPFFTTKFTGRGLGMAAVLGIVRGHKGAIKVYSEPGRGTTFKILLPASSRAVTHVNDVQEIDLWQGTGTVLLVDDEEIVRGIGSELLKELGFTTLTANDGREALEVFKSNPDITLVILDLTMPHMDGEQCYRELRQLKPDIKVIISSGYNEQEVSQKFVGKGLAGFIQKPYRLSVLKDVIQQIIP
jgi:PAS domain S-box-containing protein